MNPIPWYKSNTLRALAVSMIAQALHIGGADDALANAQAGEFVGLILDFVSKLVPFVGIAADAYAAWVRSRQPTPPLTAIAAQRTAERAAGEVAASLQSQGVVRSHWLVGLLIVTALVATLLTGCAGQNPFVKAQTPEEHAWATAETYKVVLRKGLVVVRDEQTPQSVRKAILDLELKATPAVRTLTKGVGTYSEVRAEFAAGLTTDDKLAIASSNLTKWTQDVLDLIADFNTEIGRARP